MRFTQIPFKFYRKKVKSDHFNYFLQFFQAAEKPSDQIYSLFIYRYCIHLKSKGRSSFHLHIYHHLFCYIHAARVYNFLGARTRGYRTVCLLRVSSVVECAARLSHGARCGRRESRE